MAIIITTIMIVTMMRATIIPAAIVEGLVLSEVGVGVVITKNIRNTCEYK